jgi:hypothetical protein
MGVPPLAIVMGVPPLERAAVLIPLIFIVDPPLNGEVSRVMTDVVLTLLFFLTVADPLRRPIFFTGVFRIETTS